MANTVIALKKSAVPSATPTSLANGELALNYADGKIFYKAANGTIVSFAQGGPSYGTVNENGTLVVASVSGDVLTLVPGDNISISADAITDTITISAAGGDFSPAFNQANAAFARANGIISVSDIPPSSPTANTLWWNSNNGKLYIYYVDEDGGQWVDTAAGSAGQYVSIYGGNVFGDLAVNGTVTANSVLVNGRINTFNTITTTSSIVASNGVFSQNVSSPIVNTSNINTTVVNTSNVATTDVFSQNGFFSANVGIGTTTPATKFDLNGAASQNIVTAVSTIDLSQGNFFTSNVNTATTFTFANTPANRAYSFTLEIIHTSNTITWPTSVRWPANTAPTLTANTVHLFMFITDDGGTKWRGAALVDYAN